MRLGLSARYSRWRWKLLCRLVALAAAVLHGFGGPAGATPRGRSLRTIQLRPSGDRTVLTVEMDWTFRYRTHSPPTRGETLHIWLRPEDPAALSDWPGAELLAWKRQDLVPLEEVELDRDASGEAILTLRFTRPVGFEVSQRGDLSRLRIEILTPLPLPDQGEASAGGRDDALVEDIMREGRAAMTAGDLPRAILLFTKVLGDPEHARAPEAKELLALAYQRAGKLAHARAEYEEYMERYSDAPGAPRVRQRLEALLTAASEPRRRAEETPAASRAFEHRYSGSLFQFYRSTILDSGQGGTITTTSSLDSDLFLTTRHSNGRISLRTDIAASFLYDFVDDFDSSDAVRITSAFVDLRAWENRFTARIGRQFPSGMGVLGRFDGLQMSLGLRRVWRLKVVSGVLVDFARPTRIDTSRPFYGLGIEFGPFFDHWDGEVFAIQQRVDGIEDRTSVGAQLRFLSHQAFAVGLVDYEISYRELNLLTLTGNWRVSEATSVNAFIDIRKSPALTTYNALLGQPAEDIADLRDLFSVEEIRDLAEDRTATSRMFTLGASHQLDSTWQLSGDITLSNISGTNATPGIDGTPGFEATPGTGNEYSASLRAGAANLLFEGSYTNFGFRFANASIGNRFSIGVGGRYPLIERLRFGPQMIVEYRDNSAGSNRWSYRPSIQLDYRWKSLHLEFGGGADIDVSQGSEGSGNADQTNYFFSIGYRYDF